MAALKHQIARWPAELSQPRRFVGLLAVALALSTGAVMGQTQPPASEAPPSRSVPPTACANSDESASVLLKRNTDDYVELMHLRGNVDFPQLEITGALQRMKGWLGARPTRDAVILMGQEAGRHCAYLIDADGIAAFGVSTISSANLSRVDSDWRARSGIDRGAAGRREAARTAAEREVSPPATSRFGSNRAALEAMAQSLLPGDVRRVALRYNHLYVIPYGDLGVAPYAALPSGNGATQLVDHVTISIAPNAYVFLGDDVVSRVRAVTPRSPTCEERRTSVVVGDPDPPRDPVWRFPPLPGARREASQVARTLGVSPLIGPNATGSAFLERARAAEYLHVAAHGVAVSTSASSGLEGFLAFSDGRLTAQTIQHACIPARLAVLSGCQTGLGGRHAGGIIGLTRAFHLAGVDEVIMSLWSVDDAATEQLMYLFWTKYVHRQPGETAGDALRASMIELRAEYPDPRYWAPFEVFGAPADVDRP